MERLLGASCPEGPRSGQEGRGAAMERPYPLTLRPCKGATDIGGQLLRSREKEGGHLEVDAGKQRWGCIRQRWSREETCASFAHY